MQISVSGGYSLILLHLPDSLQHMLRVHNEGMAAKERGTRGDLRAETDWRSRKFLSE